MKILILADYFPPDKIGGVGEIAWNLKNAYEQQGHQVWILTTGSKHKDEMRVIRSSPKLFWGVIINNWHALSLIKQRKIDLVHLHQSSTTIFLLFRFLWRSFPFILNSFQVSYISEAREIRRITIGKHRFFPRFEEYIEKFFYAPVHIFLDFLGFALSDKITTVSQMNKLEIQASYGKFIHKEISIIANAVSVAMFDESDLLRDDQVETRIVGKTILIYVGVFRTRKRVFNLLLALHEAIKNNPNILLLLVGGGRNYEDKILSLIKKLELSNNTIIVGPVRKEQVRYYLNLSDVFCLVSSYEGMPIALLEAMICGKAVITTNIFGMRDIIRHGQEGYLADVDDIAQLSDFIIELVNNPSQREQLSAKARNLVLREYSWSKIASQYLSLVSIAAVK